MRRIVAWTAVVLGIGALLSYGVLSGNAWIIVITSAVAIGLLLRQLIVFGLGPTDHYRGLGHL